MTTGSDRQAARFDWTAARHRLERAAAAMRAAVEPPPEVMQAVMRERARKLARPLEQDVRPRGSIDVVCFRLGGERYAIDGTLVVGIVRLRAYTAIPGTSTHLLGVTNHRGIILPVINLQRFFGLAAQGISDLSHIVVIGYEDPEIGLLVDSVEDLAFVDIAALSAKTNIDESVETDLVRGVAQDALIVLDGPRLLADVRLTNTGE